MREALILCKSVAVGFSCMLIGIMLTACAMYIYVHYVNVNYVRATAIGVKWDPVGVLRQWGLSTRGIQVLGLGGPPLLFLGGSVWGFQLFNRSTPKSSV